MTESKDERAVRERTTDWSSDSLRFDGAPMPVIKPEDEDERGVEGIGTLA